MAYFGLYKSTMVLRRNGAQEKVNAGQTRVLHGCVEGTCKNMGKSAKKKHAGTREFQYNPYGRTTTRITDLCSMFSSATASALQPSLDMDEDDKVENSLPPRDDGSEDEIETTEKEKTRGSILQRHKREWKMLRAQLEDLKAHKRAMGTATLEKKVAKKDVSNEIKRRTKELLDRHKKELADFDEVKKTSDMND